MNRLLRQTLVIARRDFVATVFAPTFLIFLFAPLLIFGFSVLSGLGIASVSDGNEPKLSIVAFATPADGTALGAADSRLRTLFRRPEAPPALEIRAPARDEATAARALFADPKVEVSAVLYGPLDRPHILHDAQGRRTATYLAQLAEQALRDRAGHVAAPLSSATIEPVARTRSTGSGRQAAGVAAVFAMFLLTMMLAGQTVSMLAEEKSNKVIEVLAAAVPLETVFMGKLIGLFGVALLFIAFWATLLAQAASLMPAELLSLAELRPAIGMSRFALLFGLYFTMSYMLLGATFLGIGAQASTIREIQMMSLPISLFQVAMLGLCNAAASAPGSTVALIAEIIPFSSPSAMAARAAIDARLWPHLLALAWQALWVGITIWLAARWFRRGVLKSGGKSGWKALFGRE